MSDFPRLNLNSLLYVPQPDESNSALDYFTHVLEQRDKMCQAAQNTVKQILAEAQAIGRRPALTQLGSISADVPPLPLTRQALLQYLNPASVQCSYEVRLVSNFRFRLIKRRQFSLAVKITPIAEEAREVAGCHLALKLFYASSPPTELVNTRRGARLLWGDTLIAASEEGKGEFKSLCFTDVTSCFPLGRLYLVIHVPERADIKALVVEGVRVKSRKKALTS